jgi:hypothetical protein
MKMDLELFLSNTQLRNSWIFEKHIQVYVRRSSRIYEDRLYNFLDIGSVEVIEEQRGRGIFTGFLKRFETEAINLQRGIYVESILEPRLIPFLKNMGYKFTYGCDETSMAPNMIKI